MPSFCAVQNCDDKYGHAENISFHKFPFKRQELMKKWLDFAQRGPDWQPSRWSAICSRHFRDEDFTCSTDRKILKKTAVPCVQVIKPIKGADNSVVQEQQNEDTSKRTVFEESKIKSAESTNRTEMLQDDCDGFEEEEENQTCGGRSNNSPSSPKIKCRLCGSVCSSVVSFSTNFEIYGMIQKCFPTLNIQKDDHLPKEMCRPCLKRLESFSRFIDKVLETQSELQRNYRSEKASSNMRVAERQVKVKQEPVVRVKQEVSEGFESFLSDDLDMAVDEGCEQEPDAEANVEQKYDFCDFPMLNAQDIINNCDIMEIINLDDPFIDIPDDDANTNCDNESQTQQQQQQERRGAVKPALPSAHELLQAHLLSEEHNYAYAAAEDMKEEWQLKNTYKTEKPEGVEHGDEFITNAEHDDEEQTGYVGDQEHQCEENDERADMYKENYPATALISTSNVNTDKLPTTTPASISPSTEETRSARPIVTSVSELADASLTMPNSSVGEHMRGEKLLVTAVNNLPVPTTQTTTISTESTTSVPTAAVKAHAKPNIVVLNESIVKSSSAFQLHTCNCCNLKFFSWESLNQHYIVAHQMQTQLGQETQARQEHPKLQGEQVQLHQQHQQIQLHNPYNQQQQNVLTQNHAYQQQQQQQQHEHQQQLEQQPMVSVPAEYLWKPYGMSRDNRGEAFNLNCKIEKGYGSPNTLTDSAHKADGNSIACQQSNMFGQSFEFSTANPTKDRLVTQNCNNAKEALAPNAVRILEMKRTFLRNHESYSNGIVNARYDYDDKMPANGENSVKIGSYCAVNVPRMENQLRTVAPSQAMLTPRSQELKRPKQRMRLNKKIIARVKALERKLNSTAASNIIATEYRQLRRLYTILQLKCKRLETQIKDKYITNASAVTKTTPAKEQQKKARLKTRFSCDICHRTQFKNIYHLLRHKSTRAHWGRRIRKHFATTCCGCEKFFRHKIALRNHMRYICQALPLCWFKFQMQTFKCRYCRRSTFNHWRLYRRHEVKCKAKLQRTKFVNVNRRQRARLKHRAVKSNLRSLTKGVVDAFKTSSVVTTKPQPPPPLPRYKHPAASTREYACSICAKVFFSANSLNQHNITHTDQRRHKCHLCTRAFKRRNGLTQHVRGFHLQLKPHQCNVCQRSYALKSDMLRCRHAVIKRAANSNVSTAQSESVNSGK